MCKNIFLILLVTAVFLAVGTASQNAKAADDPVEAIRSAKTPVYMHSLAGGDSLVHDRPSLVCTWWHSIYPPATYCHIWHVVAERDNGIPLLNPGDKLKIEHSVTHNWIWVYVDDVTITLYLKSEAFPDSFMYVEFVNGYADVGPAFVEEAIYPPVECDTLHEIWPKFCERYHLHSWEDNGNGYLDSCDVIDLVHEVTQDTTWWHVEDVAIDILVFSVADPTIPTMTQWGVIILVALIIASAIFIMLRRRKATIAA